jgi:3-oxoacyl-[acyl-carrier protein] reductase
MTIQKPGFEDLRGKRVLVTGASSGIGAAVAEAFGACGARVALHYNRNAKGAEAAVAATKAAGGEAHLLQADLTDPASHQRLAQQAIDKLGGLDILINNAGDLVGRRTLDTVDDDFFMQLFNLNVRSVVGLSHCCLPALLKGDAPCIIMTTSVAVRTGGAQGSFIYAATKGAVESLTIGLAKELGPRGIRVTAVAPSMILTPLHDGVTPPETLERVRGMVPLGRLGTAEDCVGAYLFLASPSLASYVSGITIGVTGARV